MTRGQRSPLVPPPHVILNGSGNSLTRETWLTAGEGSFGANFVTGTLVAGNFLGDDKDDLAMIYKYPSCAKVLTYESLGNHFGNWAQRHDGYGNYTFSGMQYQVFGGNLDGTGYDEMIAMYRQAERALSIYEFKNTGADKFELNTSLWNSQMIVRTESTATSTRISSETIGSDTYAYTYDTLGNITEIKKNGQTYRRYTYDDLGELIAEEVAGEYRTEYVYDNGGNILSSTKYLYENGAFQSSGETKTYAYSTGAWKDLLTTYNGQTITYDAIGNPDCWAGINLTWSDGRLLMDIDGEISFEYNSSGIRTKKECDGITHEYFLDGTTILCEKRSDGITLDFYYDESGNIFAMGYDGAMYYHVRNVLGEIIGLIDSNGAFVAKYTYDAWGWPETIEDGSGNDVQFNNSHIANIKLVTQLMNFSFTVIYGTMKTTIILIPRTVIIENTTANTLSLVQIGLPES